MRALVFLLGGAIALTSSWAKAAPIYADQVIDFFNSGAGPIDVGPYGGTEVPANYPVTVPFSYATDQDPNTFVSLPTGSYLTLGFTSGFVFDGPGNDIFISEPGASAELADVFVSSDFGATFTYLGIANGGVLTALDLATISYMGQVNAIKIVGLDNLGSLPGFDLAFVQDLEGSAIETPLPAALPMFLAGLAGLGWLARRRQKHAAA